MTLPDLLTHLTHDPLTYGQLCYKGLMSNARYNVGYCYSKKLSHIQFRTGV